MQFRCIFDTFHMVCDASSLYFALEALWEQVPRSQSGWVQKGKELDPESVNFCATFKAPQLKYLLLWRGDRDVENNCVMSCPQYEKMSGETAFRLCAAGRGVSWLHALRTRDSSATERTATGCGRPFGRGRASLVHEVGSSKRTAQRPLHFYQG